MSRDLWKVLLACNAAGSAQDAQLKEAAEKIGHQPEMGATSGNPKKTEGVIDEQVGKTEMDAKAILHTRAMEQAGQALEGLTWDDPREAANARNLAVSAGGTPKAPVDASRHNTGPKNVHLPRPVHTTPHAVKAAAGKMPSFMASAGAKAKSLAGKAGKVVKKHPFAAAGAAGAVGAAGGFAAGRKSAEYRVADHYAATLEGPDAIKTAQENVPPAQFFAAVKKASYGYLMGVGIAIGQLKEAAGIPAK